MEQLVKLTICLLLILFVAELSTAQKPELVVQTGHSAGVDAVAFSPDGKTLASGGDDNTVKLWEVSTGTELRTLKHSSPVRSLAFSPDGSTLASGSADNTVKLWDASTGTELRTLKRHSEPVNSIAFSPDGKTLASGSADNTVKLWDVSTGAELRTIKGHSNLVNSVRSVAFSPDGKTLASGSADNAVKLWDVSTGTELRSLQVNFVNSVAFSPDGKTLASGGNDTAVKLWDVSTGTELRSLKGHSAFVFSVAFSPDGKTLASGSDDNTIKLWDVSTGTELGSLEVNSWVHSVAFSPDGKTLASGGSYFDAVKLWDVSTGTESRSLKGHSHQVYLVAFSPDGKTLASVNHNPATLYQTTVTLWDISTGAESRTLKESYSVTLVAFSPDGKTLAGGCSDGAVKLWDVSTGTGLRTLKGHSEPVWSVAFSPDGKTLASGGDDNTVKLATVTALGLDRPALANTLKLWEVLTGTELRTLKHSSPVQSLAFSPDGSTLASGGDDNTVKLWNVSTGTELRTFKGHSDWVTSVAFSPDGKTMASGSADNTVKLWDTSTGTELRTLKGHSERVNSIAFSPDGKTLASGSADNTVKLWDVSTGAELRTIKGHSNLVDSVEFSPNSKYLVSGSIDTSIKVWEVASGEELASLIALDQHDWIVITPDGLFDGSPAAWNKILWRFNNNTFNYAPVEAFFGDFYYPGLLTDIFAGKHPKAPSDISQKDRRQPELKLTLAEAQPDTTKLTARNVMVKIDVSQAPAGAQDVRLFRTGSLVKVWRGDVLKGQSSVALEATIPIVAGENSLTAYAFNHDNIKSSDATLTVTGADSLKRKGTLHILAVGVSQYANREYNLNYTTDDAAALASQLKLQQEKLGRYESVNIKTLLNDDATKENILAELKKLAGSVQPEDAVVLFFSGHGKASGDHFYLVPHDLGYSGPRDQLSAAGLKQILTHSISDLELDEAFRSIDAGQIFMIIDACNSGQALENKDEPRRGPMNTRGLAQLAYEKGMYILTASQNVEEAFVSERLKHSYLTYALVEEGLKTNAADADHNGEVTLREWFDYAVARVPKLRQETLYPKSLEEVTPTIKAVRSQKSQTPRPFYRREPDTRPLVVAKVAATK
jgi:WD40 repeat protein